MTSYRAYAFSPDHRSAKEGTIRVESGWIIFEGPAIHGKIPLHNISIRRGGHNGEQIFFEHPEFPGWSIYTSDHALLNDAVFLQLENFKQVARGVDRSRKSLPVPYLIFGFLIALFLGGIVLIWSLKDNLVNFVADRIPVSWEVKLGDQSFESIRREGKLLTNTVWTSNLTEITNRLVPQVLPSPYDFRFHVMDDTNVNAFALPGGNVVILTGLLKYAESGEEVAGVLAHELAHVTRRHSLRNIIKSAGLIALIQAVFGDTSGFAAIAMEGSRFLLQQKFSRDFEREADDTGWEYLVAARIDPRGMTKFFEKMKTLAEESGAAAMEGSLALLSTHPASQERIDRLSEKWKAQSRSDWKPLLPWNR